MYSSDRLSLFSFPLYLCITGTVIALKSVILLFSNKNSPYIAFGSYGRHSTCDVVDLLPLERIAPFTQRLDVGDKDNDGVTTCYTNGVLQLTRPPLRGTSALGEALAQEKMFAKYGLEPSPSTTLRALHARMRSDRTLWTLPSCHITNIESIKVKLHCTSCARDLPLYNARAAGGSGLAGNLNFYASCPLCLRSGPNITPIYSSVIIVDDGTAEAYVNIDGKENLLRLIKSRWEAPVSVLHHHDTDRERDARAMRGVHATWRRHPSAALTEPRNFDAYPYSSMNEAAAGTSF